MQHKLEPQAVEWGPSPPIPYPYVYPMYSLANILQWGGERPVHIAEIVVQHRDDGRACHTRTVMAWGHAIPPPACYVLQAAHGAHVHTPLLLLPSTWGS